MSVLWKVDQSRAPTILQASLTVLILAGHRGPILDIVARVRRQLAFWNDREIETHSTVFGAVRLRFRLRARLGTDGDTDRSHSRAGWYTTRIAPQFANWFWTHPQFPRGLAILCPCAHGFDGTRSCVRAGGIIRYTDPGMSRDDEGPERSLVLAHELGHVLGLDDRYSSLDRPPRRVEAYGGYLTRSDPGYEGNIMGDVRSDRRGAWAAGRRPRRIWVGQDQVRRMVSGASQAIAVGRFTTGSATYFYSPEGLKQVHRPSR